MNSTTSTTSFYMNSTDSMVDSKRDSICISIEEFEELMSYKRICQDLFKKFGDDLLE